MYMVAVNQFEGPLALLLELIESAELDITRVSLSHVTDQFLEYVNANTVSPDELADFLLVAAKLLVIKSKALFPEATIPEEPGMPLELQLGLYRVYHDKAREMERMIRAKRWAYWRKAMQPSVQFNPPPRLDIPLLFAAWERILGIVRETILVPKALLKKTVTLTERICEIQSAILRGIKLSFKKYTARAGTGSKAEMIVSFLAILELARREIIHLNQQSLFGDITITHHGKP